MDTNLNDKIDRFLKNEMDPTEQADFIRLIDSDPELKEKVRIRQLLIEAETIEAEQKLLKQDPESKALRRSSSIRFAAACITIIILMGIYIGSSYIYQPKELIESQYMLPTIETSRGYGAPNQQIAVYNNQIALLYEQEQNSKITSLYKETLKDSLFTILSPTAQMQICFSLWKNNETEEIVNAARQINDPDYKESSDWLILGCYLRQNKRTKALEQSRQIINDAGTYKDKAGEIYMALKEKRWF
ncbi:hypothetical protein [uncultured Bacteroides sp.]|uniref:hypothetical protein n=1 Tax=uncultured Bacteroides sp. TaxID=162156 RepID=UPI0026319461|nr:hypothetical protein [uncultured Bacteroides sp.]